MVIRVALALLLAMLAFVLTGGAPQPMAVTSIHYNNGWEADPYDGCLGNDEDMGVVATGALAGGETFIFVPPQPDCHAYRYLKVIASKTHGRADLIVSLDVWGPNGAMHKESSEGFCVRTPYLGQGFTYWSASVTNLSRKAVRDVIFYIADWFTMDEDCPA